MDEIRVRYMVNQKAAVLAGQKFYGEVETTVDPAMLTEAQRQELAKCDTDKGVFILNRYSQDVGDYMVGTREDAHIITFLDVRIKVRQDKEAREQRERNDNYAHCEAHMKGENRATILEKIVRGEKIGWVFPGSTQDAEKWWADHQSAFADEMTAIRARIQREKREEEERTAQIVKERAATVIAEGISGILQYDDAERAGDRWSMPTYIGGDSESIWKDRAVPEVLGLIAQAKAEVEKRNGEDLATCKAQLDSWIAEKGTENQKGRHALGLLPEDEVMDAMRDEAYASLDSFPRYEKIKKGDLDHSEYCGAGISCSVLDADHLTAEQYDQFAAIQKAAPQGAKIEALAHECECKECDAKLARLSAKVSLAVGAFAFTREYAL